MVDNVCIDSYDEIDGEDVGVVIYGGTRYYILAEGLRAYGITDRVDDEGLIRAYVVDYHQVRILVLPIHLDIIVEDHKQKLEAAREMLRQLPAPLTAQEEEDLLNFQIYEYTVAESRDPLEDETPEDEGSIADFIADDDIEPEPESESSAGAPEPKKRKAQLPHDDESIRPFRRLRRSINVIDDA
jgi:hypothetical protein